MSQHSDPLNLAELCELQVGTRITISNAQPQPPAHHKRKLKEWQSQNYIGYVYEVDQEDRHLKIVKHAMELKGQNVKLRVRAIYIHSMTGHLRFFRAD